MYIAKRYKNNNLINFKDNKLYTGKHSSTISTFSYNYIDSTQFHTLIVKEKSYPILMVYDNLRQYFNKQENILQPWGLQAN